MVLVRSVFFLVLCFTLLSCGTIRFVQEERPEVIMRSKWHHIGWFGLVELSKPFSISENCRNGFSYVETNTSATQAALKALSHLWFFTYQPESVSVACFPENREEHQRVLASVTSDAGTHTLTVLKVKGEKALVQFSSSASLSDNQRIQLNGISEAVVKMARGHKAVIYTRGQKLEPNTVHTATLK
ncbi:MAG: hypothetical protein OXB86_02915 [Bdellovibrionales bacterium]|nr:hypothetical protein [Bdellovibrionales bacterium]